MKNVIKNIDVTDEVMDFAKERNLKVGLHTRFGKFGMEAALLSFHGDKSLNFAKIADEFSAMTKTHSGQWTWVLIDEDGMGVQMIYERMNG